jgi:dTMP kinase
MASVHNKILARGWKRVLLELAEKKQLKHGILFAVEGIDGAGKTTQSQMLFKRLRNAGYSATLLHEPTNGKWGEKIRALATNGRQEISPEQELELFYQDRVEDVNEHIKPELEQKNIVIMDRYYFSNITYQGARGLDPNYIERKNEQIAPPPDLVIILDITPSESLRRINGTREGGPNHFEKAKDLEKVRELFLKQFCGRINVAIVDGNSSHSKKEVFNRLWSLVDPIVRAAEET